MARVTNFGDYQAYTDRLFRREEKYRKQNIVEHMNEMKVEYNNLIAEMKEIFADPIHKNEIEAKKILGVMLMDLSIVASNLNIYLGDIAHDQLCYLHRANPKIFGAKIDAGFNFNKTSAETKDQKYKQKKNKNK